MRVGPITPSTPTVSSSRWYGAVTTLQVIEDLVARFLANKYLHAVGIECCDRGDRESGVSSKNASNNRRSVSISDNSAKSMSLVSPAMATNSEAVDSGCIVPIADCATADDVEPSHHSSSCVVSSMISRQGGSLHSGPVSTAGIVFINEVRSLRQFRLTLYSRSDMQYAVLHFAVVDHENGENSIVGQRQEFDLSQRGMLAAFGTDTTPARLGHIRQHLRHRTLTSWPGSSALSGQLCPAATSHVTAFWFAITDQCIDKHTITLRRRDAAG